MSRIIFSLLVLMSAVQTIWASPSITVTGTVKDKDGEALSGTVVTVVGNDRAYAVVGDDGRYSLSVPDDAEMLRFRLLGYVTQDISLSEVNDNILNVVLEEDLMNMETVVVTGTRTPRLLKESPILTRVITSLDIQRVDALNIGDLLESELPGIEFSYAMDQQVTLNMQGFGGNSVLFLVDGERVAGETLDNIDYNRLNLDNVQRVEIIKGAVSSLYGSNAVGGVVNLISAGASEPWQVNVNARYGAHNEQRYGGSVGFIAGKFNSLTNAQYTSIDSYAMPSEGDYSTFYGGYNWSVKERLQYEPLQGLRFTARAGYFFRERDLQSDTKDRYRDFSGGLKGEWDVNDRNRIELSYGFDQYDKSDWLLFNSTDVRDYSNVQHTVRGIYTYDLTADGKSTMIVGGDYMRDYLMSYQFTDNGSHTQHTADAFAQFDWNPHRRFNLIAGVRFDYFSAASLTHLSPKLGVMYKVENCSLRASYAGGFRAPTLKEMYMDFYMGNIFMIYGNPGLKAETSHNFSLSAEYMAGQHNFTVTGFYNLVDNRITTVWSQPLAGQVYTNMSPLQVAGAEANATGRYACGISWRVSYAYTREMIERGQPLLSSTRPHAATARLAYGKQWKNYGLNVALSGRWLSRVTCDVYTQLTSYEQTVRQTYPGYTIWKLSLTQHLWRGMDLSLAVDNLFNYRPDYYYSNSPTTIGTTCSVGLSLNLEQFFKRK